MIFAQSAAVTNAPLRTALVIAFVVVFALALVMMRRSWLKKKAAQAHIATPLDIPSDFDASFAVEGRFLATSTTGDWLTRITVHTLGVPSRAIVRWGRTGIAVDRPSELSFFVPWADVIAVRSDRAIAGRAFEKDGIAVITIKLGDAFVEFGFRADAVDGHMEVLKMMAKQESGA